ncbi:MAG: radical SAM protein [Deltaproteobacteria bacterium]|nr:radical SAM protein [Deltaproteobacteria bacterium]
MDIRNHPCFNGEAKSKYGRVHLPVAPKCNIQCNFCNKKYDCVSESRPGVTSAVLSPEQSIAYLEELMEKAPNISVVGVAGPGDPFANGDNTMETLRMVRKKYPNMLLCVATNGLELEPYIDELVALDVSHITITINAVKPEVAAGMYSWVRFKKHRYLGIDGAKILLEQQHKALSKLVKTDTIIKINTVVVPGKNDHHLKDIGNYLLEMGVDMQNCMAFHPVENTPFEEIDEPDPLFMAQIRLQASGYIEQMTHCSRCRADAAGKIGESCSAIGADVLLEKYSKMPKRPKEHRPYVAVVSNEGLLVNRHLGEATEFLIYKIDEEAPSFVEKRAAPSPGGGDKRWETVAAILSDCRSLLVRDAGPKPTSILDESGIQVLRLEGLIDDILPAIQQKSELEKYYKTEKFSCNSGKGCTGKGMGCM